MAPGRRGLGSSPGPRPRGRRSRSFHSSGEELARAPTPYARRLIARALARAGEVEAFPWWCSGAPASPSPSGRPGSRTSPRSSTRPWSCRPSPAASRPRDLPTRTRRGRSRTWATRRSGSGTLAGEPFEGDGEPPAWVEDGASLRVPVPDGDAVAGRAWVYALRRPGPELATSELTWLGGSTQGLDEHGRRVGEAARGLGAALESGLDPGVAQALGLAGEWHDTGKSRRVWQLAAGAAPDGAPLAKARRGRLRAGALRGYRHELGSLADAEQGAPPRGAPPRPRPSPRRRAPRVGAARVPARGAVGPGVFGGGEPGARGAGRATGTRGSPRRSAPGASRGSRRC